MQLAVGSGYEFLAFDDLSRFEDKKVCLLRHDIDVDLGAALEIAKIEATLGVRSTYFVMLRSPVYNLLGRANTRLLQEILSLGHWLGLHYDEAFIPDETLNVNERITWEAEVVGKIFGVKIGSVSFHQPSDRVLRGEVKPASFVTTYDREVPAAPTN